MYKEDYMNKTTIIIIVSFVSLIVLLVVILLIIKQKSKKNIINSIDRLTKDKNMIISPILISELNKAKKLANNKKIEKEIEKWNTEFNEISTIDSDNITNKILEIENSFCEKKYKDAESKIVDVEKEILHSKAKSNQLLGKVKELTESEDRNREAITKLKSLYREIVFKYNKNKDEYKDVSNSIDLQFENIDKLFSAFEVSISKNEYEEISKIVKVLDDMIHNIGVVIDEAPTIVLMCKILLPKKMNDIQNISGKLLRDGYNLEYLNLDYNFEETNKRINEIMDKLNVLNLEDSIFELKTLMDYYEGLYSDFDNEKRGKKEYERGIINVSERLNKVSSIIRNLYSEIEDLKDTYALTEDEIRVIDEINKELIDVKDSFKLVNDRTLIKMFPYSKLDN
jgi:septation ring formation regulator